MMSNEKRSDPYVSVRTIYVAIPLYILQFPACCREYVGKIYELEYYYHPPILFVSSFSFSFSFSFFIFHFTLYQLPYMGPICYFIKIYSYEILF
jgi:hypothetical protein